MEIPTLTTSRLILRPFTEHDAGALYRVLSEPEILRYFPGPAGAPSQERVERFILGQLRHWEEHGFGWWAVVPLPDEGVAGWNGLQYLPETDEIEVGFLLSHAYWNRGLTTEGAWASLEFGFERLGLNQVVAIVHPENLASRRVIEKLGMSLTVQTEYFGMAACRYAIEAHSFKERAAGIRTRRRSRSTPP